MYLACRVGSWEHKMNVDLISSPRSLYVKCIIMNKTETVSLDKSTHAYASETCNFYFCSFTIAFWIMICLTLKNLQYH